MFAKAAEHEKNFRRHPTRHRRDSGCQAFAPVPVEWPFTAFFLAVGTGTSGIGEVFFVFGNSVASIMESLACTPKKTGETFPSSEESFGACGTVKRTVGRSLNASRRGQSAETDFLLGKGNVSPVFFGSIFGFAETAMSLGAARGPSRFVGVKAAPSGFRFTFLSPGDGA